MRSIEATLNDATANRADLVVDLPSGITHGIDYGSGFRGSQIVSMIHAESDDNGYERSFVGLASQYVLAGFDLHVISESWSDAARGGKLFNLGDNPTNAIAITSVTRLIEKEAGKKMVFALYRIENSNLKMLDALIDFAHQSDEAVKLIVLRVSADEVRTPVAGRVMEFFQEYDRMEACLKNAESLRKNTAQITRAPALKRL